MFFWSALCLRLAKQVGPVRAGFSCLVKAANKTQWRTRAIFRGEARVTVQEYKVPFVPPAIHILNVSAGGILIRPADCSQLRMLLPVHRFCSAEGLSRMLPELRMYLLQYKFRSLIVCSILNAQLLTS